MTKARALTREGAAPLPLDVLRPYVTLTIIECVAEEASTEIARLRERIVALVASRGRVSRSVYALTENGNPPQPEQSVGSTDDTDPEVHALVYTERSEPAWVKDSGLFDVSHHLALWCSHGRFVAVRADGYLADALQRWLDREPKPMFRRIPADILENVVFRSGEVTNLWLRGVHTRRRTMADTKYLSGPGLRDALNPNTDSSFALGAGRGEIALDDASPDDTEPIGCTPSKSTVWVKQSADFQDFLKLTREILVLVASAVAAGSMPPAYALVTCSADEVGGGTGSSDDARNAAALLEDAELNVRPASGPDFYLEVGLGGRVGGVLKCVVSLQEGKVRLAFGIHGAPTDITLVRPVLDALKYTELVTVYYESGHALTSDAVWESSLASAAFPEWRWADFAGYDVTAEKPSTKPAEVHALAGTAGDRSLFSWVAHTFRSGLLTCDDGAGEVADFVHLAHDETLSLIHVKAASSSSAQRSVAVQRFEVVVGQAVKNAVYLDGENLRSALSGSRASNSAAWLDGVRVADRSDMLDFLKVRSPRAVGRVIVVQPHMTQTAYESAWRASTMPVRLLDTLLNSARGSIVGVGGELQVWGARLPVRAAAGAKVSR